MADPQGASQPPLALDVSVQASRFHEVAGAALHLRGLCIAVGSASGEQRELLSDADVSLSPGTRVALVGRNGSGKSILLKVLASGAALDPDCQLLLRAQLVTQSFAPAPTPTWTVADEVAVPPLGFDLSDALSDASRAARRAELRSGRRGKAAREVAVAAAGAEASTSSAEAAAEEAAPDITETLAAFRAVGIPLSMLSQPWATLSGGWKMRVVLAKAVLYHPSLLLLDEPTVRAPLRSGTIVASQLLTWPLVAHQNHLDIGGINHLIALLRSDTFAETTILFVTHDLFFINQLAQQTLQLQDGKLTLATGNWDTLQRERRDRKAFAERHAAEQEKGRARLLASIDETMRSAGRDDKLRKQLASRRAKALERDVGLQRNSRGHRWRRNADENAGYHDTLLNAVEQVHDERPVRFRFEEPDLGRRGAGGSLLSVDGLSFAYRDSAFSLHLADLWLTAGERLVLLGPNGHGKSTLLKLLAGELPSGDAVKAAPTALGYYEQHAVTRLGGVNQSALELVMDARRRLGGVDTSDQEARADLGRFGLGPYAETPAALLSGGQRVALEMVTIALSAPALLLLDEPSAHLDLQAREALALAIAGFAGAVMFVSHDVGFIELCDPTRALVCVHGRFREADADNWKRAALELH